MIRTAAWRIADRRALTIIFSCVPSSLKRDLRPPSSPSLWKSLSSQYDRQDLRSLLSLFRTFQDITLDSSLNAASFARRLTDTAHLRLTFCVNLPPSMPFMRAKEQTPAEAAGADQDVARAVVEEEAVAEVDEEGALGNVAGVGQPLQPRQVQHLLPTPTTTPTPPTLTTPTLAPQTPPSSYPPLSPYPPPYAGWPYPLYPPSLVLLLPPVEQPDHPVPQDGVVHLPSLPPPPLMADQSTSLELASIDKLELLNGTTAVNWVSFEESLFTYLGSVRAPPPPDAPPLPTEPAPQAPILGAWEDNPDRWARTLNKYNKERDDYVIKSRAHEAAIADHEAATAKLAEFKAASEAYSTQLRKHHSDTAAWRIADRRALTIIFSCVPSSLKRDLRPPSSPSLWKSLTSQYDRQDLRSLLSLFRTFQDITLDSSLNAASFARRLTDTAQRLNDRGILISDTLLTARILDCLPPTYDTYRINFTSQHIRPPPVAVTIDWLLDTGADQDVARAVVEEEAVAEVDEEGALGNVAGVGQPLQPRQVQHLLPTPTTTPTPPILTTPTPAPQTPPSPYPPLSPYPPPYAGWPYPPYPPSLSCHHC
ncbi:unnamed protein product [Closterium sp. NIES-64]|nr:unnamed protein product [Closterium sp. NIES-64]